MARHERSGEVRGSHAPVERSTVRHASGGVDPTGGGAYGSAADPSGRGAYGGVGAGGRTPSGGGPAGRVPYGAPAGGPYRANSGRSRKKTVLIVVLLVLLAICIAVAVWALFFRGGPELAPDYAPGEEIHAMDLGDSGDKLDQPEGGGAVSLTYATEVGIDLSDAQASLTFANPSKSNQSMVVQIVVQDVVVAQSGTIVPGKRVETLDLLDGAADQLSPGGYDGNLLVLYYQPDSGEKATVNTEIPVHITVQE